MGNSRESIVLVADLPDYASLVTRDPGRAAELASVFHQVLGECVYAYGGTVHDTMGSTVIAELREPAEALHCLQNLQQRTRELSSHKTSGPRVVLSSGEVHDRNFSIAGQAVQNSLSILDALKQDQMLVSSKVLAGAGMSAEGEPLLELGDTGYFAFPVRPSGSPGAKAKATSESLEGSPLSGESDEQVAVSPVRSRRTLAIAGIVIVVVLIAAVAAVLMMRGAAPETVTGAVTPAPAPAPADTTLSLSIGDVWIAPDVATEVVPTAAATALMNTLLRSAGDVRIDASAPNQIGADIRMVVPPAPLPDDGPNPAAAQPAPIPVASEPPAEVRVVPWIERAGERFEGPPGELGDVWSIVIPTIRWAGEHLGFETAQILPQSPTLRSAFEKVVQSSVSRARDSDLAALHAALANEPEFLPGWLVLSRAQTTDSRLAPLIMDGLRNVSRIMPERDDLARQLGRRELEEGTLAGAVEAFSRVRAKNRSDEEALRVLALSALAAHEADVFRDFASKSRDPRLHPSDVEVTEGRINDAVRKYYETEARTPDNPYLSFKIGRIAVLRRSAQIARIETDKLEAQGVEPQRSLLRAYVAADAGDRSGAEAALDEAHDNAEWADSVSFHTAEVRAILRDARQTLTAIEQSVARREPMMHTITTNPLFGHLTNEPRFREAVRLIEEYQSNVAASLADQS